MDFENCNFNTDRLSIRPLNFSDYDSWFLGFSERKKSQYRHDKGRINLSDKDKKWFNNLVKKHRELFENDEIYIFSIFDKKGKHLGMIDIVTIERENFQWGECGFYIHNQFWNNGYAFESMLKILDIANKELGFHRLEAHVNLDNEPSFKLLEKLGFEFECTRKGFIYEFGEWTDNYIYFINLHDEKL
ncbi:GNAT family N-acetyltransferase [Staphylococcus hominis]|uniref:GNAT family N-acetyltransferase n=1 Tax=Staphylococcus TaxID=1279 RepID=UPI000CD082FA|nr:MULTISPECIES: GNAT family N-acetyltransferase [Staphylococcus]AYY65378.1 N-acetyltransferase [Staphylococcus hominis]MCI2889765.1 GNAT family N-acetyltransferase [Staphylococcus hominis]MCI2893966.1 GNAT family N-acetyltransferase [Staphylococcus hominis]MCI2902491.1 GNAT family N-acetyltransferase [Staphylococcus hominis]MCW9136820.1 GNAT family N-acetyltransferase [Staphylococcus haemolyticus]